jgi:hypothetical protein
MEVKCAEMRRLYITLVTNAVGNTRETRDRGQGTRNREVSEALQFPSKTSSILADHAEITRCAIDSSRGAGALFGSLQ